MKYFPHEITRLDTGLTIYDSFFESADGSTGIVAGPHPEFTKTERNAHFVNDKRFSYYSQSVEKYLDLVSMQHEVPFLGHKGKFADVDQSFSKRECAEYEMTSTISTNSRHFMKKWAIGANLVILLLVGMV